MVPMVPREPMGDTPDASRRLGTSRRTTRGTSALLFAVHQEKFVQNPVEVTVEVG